METALRAALIDRLQNDYELSHKLNLVAEEAPLRKPLPWLGIAASASLDWSTKDYKGREVRVALELHSRGDDPETALALLAEIEALVESLPRQQPDFQIVTLQFLRSRAEQRAHNTRAMLIEYRFRLMAHAPTPDPIA